jgi:hypothetical protein
MMLLSAMEGTLRPVNVICDESHRMPGMGSLRIEHHDMNKIIEMKWLEGYTQRHWNS